MKVLNLLHHKEITKEFKFIEEGQEVEVSRITLDKNATVIVGANNSRKSRFLRYVLKEKSYLINEKDTFLSIDKLKRYLTKIPENEFLAFKIITPYNSQNQDYLNLVNKFGINMNKVDKKTFSDLIYEYRNLGNADKKKKLEKIEKLIDFSRVATKLAYNYLNYNIGKQFDVFIEGSILNRKKIPQFLKHKELIGNLKELFESLSGIFIDLITPKRTYIPTLRGTVKLIQKNSISNKCFELTTAQNYGLPEDVQIFTGLDLYQKIKSVRNSKRTIREGFEQFEAFLSNNFFGGKTVDIIT